jgi:hypothetical protein
MTARASMSGPAEYEDPCPKHLPRRSLSWAGRREAMADAGYDRRDDHF